MKRIWDLFIYAMKNSFKISGRACRMEIGSFFIMQLLFGLIFGILLTVFVIIPGAAAAMAGQDASAAGVFGMILYIVYFVFSLIMIPASFTLGVRRLHDIDMSAWFILLFFVLMLIPLVNLVVSLVMLYLYYIKIGSEGENKFGAPSVNF